MRQLLNTLFVTSEDIYLSLDGENVVASREHQEAARYPLHTLSGIVSFSYPGASPALMGACAERGISLAFCTPRGRFLARIAGSTSGNVLLRRAQYRTADELSASCRIARSMIFGKVYNARWSIERTRRDHGLRLDSYVGFLHRDRPGRASLALDLMEELRPCMADRFVLTLINNRIVGRQDFDFLENGAVFLSDSGRRAVLKRWQERKKESLTHPYLQEKLSWGLVPYLQALLLARCLRGDLDAYPPFLWK